MRPAPFRLFFGHPEAALRQQLPVAGVLNRLVSDTANRVSKTAQANITSAVDYGWKMGFGFAIGLITGKSVL